MFTGLITHIGRVTEINPLGEGISIWVEAPSDIIRELSLGDSIALNGVCTTVVELEKSCFKVELLKETLKRTSFSECNLNDELNLELCLTPSTRLGGHLVSGHIDTTGTLQVIDQNGPWHVLQVSFPRPCRPLLIPKGSIALHGISLTVVDVLEESFTCHIIPHTFTHTCLKSLKEGCVLNLEFDQMGKYLFNFYMLNDVERVSLYEMLNKDRNDS